ncbi:MAG: YfcE family phosphodiesterase [Candidatus Thorarchaeota archaeon]
MMKILVFGDTHIPTRRDSIPDAFYSIIEDRHYDLALITGDLVEEHAMRESLPILPRCCIVRGNMDYSYDHNFHEEINIGDLEILLLHGTQLRPRGSIEQIRDILDNVGCDIAIHGHTHEAQVKLYEGRLILNPGTLSGATGVSTGRQEASFIEMEVDGSTVKIVLYKTDWNTLKKSTLSFEKNDGAMV